MRSNSFSKSDQHSPDWLLIASFALLIFLGLLILSSASSAVSYQLYGDNYRMIKHQITSGLLPGLVLMVIFSFINYRHWKKIANIFLGLSIIFLITVFIPSLNADYGTAMSWITIAGISIQPAEIVKLTFLLYLANWLEKRGSSGVKDFYNGFLPFLFLIGVISILILKQPDMGTLSVIIFMSMAVFFASGAKIKHVSMILLGGISAIYLLIKSASYRADRFTTFLHPELDPLGLGYHINQAFLAIGSGGFWGRGFGNSRQKFLYLPESTGDSIFAITAEEMGFIFAFFLICLFLFIAYRGFRTAKYSIDQFGRLLAIGIVSWLTFQAFFNICSMVGLTPMTGIPLPFVSYGGTAMVIGMAAMGILINISRQTKTE